jgi:hypothetical protein
MRLATISSPFSRYCHYSPSSPCGFVGFHQTTPATVTPYALIFAICMPNILCFHCERISFSCLTIITINAAFVICIFTANRFSNHFAYTYLSDMAIAEPSSNMTTAEFNRHKMTAAVLSCCHYSLVNDVGTGSKEGSDLGIHELLETEKQYQNDRRRSTPMPPIQTCYKTSTSS